MGEVMEMRTVTIKGVVYREVPDTDETRGCEGCAGDKTGEGICGNLPWGCSGRNTKWVRTQERPTLTQKRLPYFTTLYVPASKYASSFTDSLTIAAGGSTRSSGVGEYIMKDGKKCEEFINKVTVFFDAPQRSAVLAAVRGYVTYLLESGEESVLVESNDGTNLYTK
jgi:hypothetical protein